MNKSKEKKEAKRKLQDMECNHGDLEWCEGCAYDMNGEQVAFEGCLLYTSPSPRDLSTSRMPSSA